MATASKILLTPETTGGFPADGIITEESARVVSELLQVYHIAHQLLTIFSLGATPDQLRQAYDSNKSYQRPKPSAEKPIILSLSEDSVFRSCLDKHEHFHSFLAFYENEINQKGWEKAVAEHVFRKPIEDGGRAQELFVRLYASLLHPLMHLGFGISFKQPAIIAEALAQAATHENHLTPLLLTPPAPKTANPPSLFTILDRAQKSETIRNSAKWEDANKLYDGALTRALGEIKSIFSDYHIPADAASITKAAAEMTSLNGYFTLTALRPDRAPKIDFFYLHSFNSTIFFRTFNALPEHILSLEYKARLLEAKAKVDIGTYISRACPPLSVAELEKYTAERATSRKNNAPTNGTTPHGHAAEWTPLFRACTSLTTDDGHVAKAIRAAASAAEVCAPYEDAEQWPLRGQNWLEAAKMVLESVNVPAKTGPWVRSTGFEEAWEGVPVRGGGEGEARL
ncbi:MAG: hypothetical protein Q9160_001916 [Pyrenula sp. 1 TL-2023]